MVISFVVASRDKNQPQGDLPYVYIVLKKNVHTERQRQIKSEIIELCQDKLPEYAQKITELLRKNIDLLIVNGYNKIIG